MLIKELKVFGIMVLVIIMIGCSGKSDNQFPSTGGGLGDGGNKPNPEEIIVAGGDLETVPSDDALDDQDGEFELPPIVPDEDPVVPEEPDDRIQPNFMLSSQLPLNQNRESASNVGIDNSNLVIAGSPQLAKTGVLQTGVARQECNEKFVLKGGINPNAYVGKAYSSMLELTDDSNHGTAKWQLGTSEESLEDIDDDYNAQDILPDGITARIIGSSLLFSGTPTEAVRKSFIVKVGGLCNYNISGSSINVSNQQNNNNTDDNDAISNATVDMFKFYGFRHPENGRFGVMPKTYLCGKNSYISQLATETGDLKKLKITCKSIVDGSTETLEIGSDIEPYIVDPRGIGYQKNYALTGWVVQFDGGVLKKLVPFWSNLNLQTKEIDYNIERGSQMGNGTGPIVESFDCNSGNIILGQEMVGQVMVGMRVGASDRGFENIQPICAKIRWDNNKPKIVKSQTDPKLTHISGYHNRMHSGGSGGSECEQICGIGKVVVGAKRYYTSMDNRSMLGGIMLMCSDFEVEQDGSIKLKGTVGVAGAGYCGSTPPGYSMLGASSDADDDYIDKISINPEYLSVGFASVNASKKLPSTRLRDFTLIRDSYKRSKNKAILNMVQSLRSGRDYYEFICPGNSYLSGITFKSGRAVDGVYKVHCTPIGYSE